MSDLRIELDESICCGSGMCAAIAPEAFAVAPDGVAVELPGAGAVDGGTLLRAAKSCPTLCISLYRGDEEIELF
ncbi:ferredoxin [Streptosporangium sp. NPDC051022]|uniref:ferredoxin n=1 Tax=Streptosporangium sp. NPDC051022 TaxID=3155752 RepID=UPI0034419AC2